MVKIISNDLKAVIEEQIGKERYNASAYLHTNSYFNSMGCPNIAAFFKKQHDEEIEHSLILADLMNDLGVFFNIPPIDGCDTTYVDWKNVADLFLQAEIDTTNSLMALRDMAIDEKCPIVEERIRKMIKLQQVELKESTDFCDKMNNLPDWSYVILLDVAMDD